MGEACFPGNIPTIQSLPGKQHRTVGVYISQQTAWEMSFAGISKDVASKSLKGRYILISEMAKK